MCLCYCKIKLVMIFEQMTHFVMVSTVFKLLSGQVGRVELIQFPNQSKLLVPLATHWLFLLLAINSRHRIFTRSAVEVLSPKRQSLPLMCKARGKTQQTMADASGHICGSQPGIITPDGSNKSQRSRIISYSHSVGLI